MADFARRCCDARAAQAESISDFAKIELGVLLLLLALLLALLQAAQPAW